MIDASNYTSDSGRDDLKVDSSTRPSERLCTFIIVVCHRIKQ